MSRFIPTLNRVLIQKVTQPTKSAGGILLPAKQTSGPAEGVVIAVGPGLRNIDGVHVPCVVKVGDKVLVPEFSPNTVTQQNEIFHIYRDTEILGLLE